MCQKGTSRSHAPILALGLIAVVGAAGEGGPDWRKVGTSAVEWMLASPATGPVEQVWFSADGGRLFARSQWGKTFTTNDFETWTPVDGATSPIAPAAPAAVRLPDPMAQLVASAADPLEIYALGQELSRSVDGGRTWTSLTQYHSLSIVGGGQRSLATSPADPDELVLGNDYGVWRSLDGGLSWTGLNRLLPNLPVGRILSTPSGTAGIRVEAGRFGVLELPPGGATWFPATGVAPDDGLPLLGHYSARVGAEITAVGKAGAMVYVGSSDGRIWASFDGGQTFQPSRVETGGAVERIFVDAGEPRLALVALSGAGARVLRTTSSGSLWDDLTANLPAGAVHGITAERAAGAVYVATDRGVFWARTDLEGASLPSLNWVSLTDSLPQVAATDVRLDPAGVQLYISLVGYGVYATAAPHRLRNLRLVNTADYSARAAAPGSLVSVIGGRVDSARAAGLNYPVLAASDTESQLQVPFEATGTNVILALQTRAGLVTLGLPVQPVSPAIMVGRDGVPVLLDADSGLEIDAHNPAHSSGRMQILATGLGKVRPDWPTGLAAPIENPPAVVADVKVYLDGAPLPVTRATLAPSYIGFYLIEVQLPPITNLGTSELYLSAGGQESNRVPMVLEP